VQPVLGPTSSFDRAFSEKLLNLGNWCGTMLGIEIIKPY
jgi:hypothetical protein